VLCIPASPFFSEDCVKGEDGDPLSDQFVRIAFCKTDDTIQAAAAALMKIRDEETNGREQEAEKVPISSSSTVA
jgi:kynurenine--oxoglutarate transaminase/cysteine-S-conjugate beta-lyase/glutamine--phenylpyruvate transaminase